MWKNVLIFFNDLFFLFSIVSHPFFKTVWLINDDKKNKTLAFFNQSCLEMFEQSNTTKTEG